MKDWSNVIIYVKMDYYIHLSQKHYQKKMQNIYIFSIENYIKIKIKSIFAIQFRKVK